MEINPKVNNAAENGDLEQTLTGLPSQTGDVQVSDDVFGEVGEDGPNYRNVGVELMRVLILTERLTTCQTGRLDRCGGAHVEVANRYWRSLYPDRIRCLGHDSWYYLLAVHRISRDVVGFHRWSFQAAPSACVWPGRRWNDDCWTYCS